MAAIDLHQVCAKVHVGRGSNDEAVAQLGAARRLMAKTVDPQYRAELRAREAELALWQRRPAEAATAVAAGLRDLIATDDVWFVGPNDLAHRMGHPGRADLPEVQDAVLSTLGAIQAAGRIAGTLATAGTAQTMFDAGARLLMTRVTDLLAQGSRDYHWQLPRTAAAGTTTK